VYPGKYGQVAGALAMGLPPDADCDAIEAIAQ
jgi:hypothetical protein